MATTSIGLLYPAQTMRELAGLTDQTATDIPLQIAMVGAIGTAVAQGLFTCTLDCSTYGELNVRSMINNLNGLGYGTSYSGHTLTLTW
jgi:hypothetical protein